MNYKRILSVALAVVMVFSMVAVFIPTRVSAAHSPSASVGGPSYTQEEVKKIVEELSTMKFSSAEERLEYERGKGYLDSSSSAGNKNTIYINRYTGYLYYVNNQTGEILTSNPYDVTFNNSWANELMGQIFIDFSTVANSTSSERYTSTEWAAKLGQISVMQISNGLRVSYTMGDTASRFLVPGRITAARFEEEIVRPIHDRYVELLELYYGEAFPEKNFSFFDNEAYADVAYEGTAYNHEKLKRHILEIRAFIISNASKTEYNSSTPEFKDVDRLLQNFLNLLNQYTMVNKDSAIGTNGLIIGTEEERAAQQALLDQGIAFLNFKGQGQVNIERTYAGIVKTYCPDYTFEMMYADEAECGFFPKVAQKPVFRCSLEYTFNSDGSLSVRLPSNSISFDETVYILNSISTLKYFGTGDLTTDGYVFIPDGSGSVTKFSEFFEAPNSQRNESFDLSLEVYGKDYAYSTLSTTTVYNEQVSMPVYGMISGNNASSLTESLTGNSTVTNGYFAILEEGASLASLRVVFNQNHQYPAVYSSFSPYPADTVSLSGENNGIGYKKVSESKYLGSYVTRYVLLSDVDAAMAAGIFSYAPNYSGMAGYYREYLKGKGELETLEEINENLPLYIEALGSMEIVKKILSFPVTTSIPLTSFEDVVTMYDELARAKERFLEKADEYDALAEAEVKDLDMKLTYKNKADSYRKLAEEIIDVTNINFRLTGFANGGMYYTYPTRVKWEKTCGGKSGFEALLDSADSKTVGSAVFGVYPEFDFAFISNTAMFDGISNKNTVSRMVDNRYASKQVYNIVSNMWESFFTLVVSPDAYDRLYTKFYKDYSDYDVKGISVSTLGGSLNSNFDKKNPVNREDSIGYVTLLLEKITKDNGYSVMLDAGNIYSVKYADHIVNIATDSSHFRYSSYAVPFVGMVLHSYVSYAGSPLNYSGDPDYDILRSIENGATLFYILCYQNTGYMKDDEALNKYYGVDYKTWYDDMVVQYSKLNATIGRLQGYEIVEHSTLLAERVIDSDEVYADNVRLAKEFLAKAEEKLISLIADKQDEMLKDDANIGRGIKVDIDVDTLMAIAKEMLNMTDAELVSSGLKEGVEKLAEEYESYYKGVDKNSELVVLDSVSYTSRYNYVTDSFATDKDYVFTDYTVDNNLVSIVTYRDAATNHEVKFILNYNIYSVRVSFADGTVYEIAPTSFEPIGLNK